MHFVVQFCSRSFSDFSSHYRTETDQSPPVEKNFRAVGRRPFALPMILLPDCPPPTPPPLKI